MGRLYLHATGPPFRLGRGAERISFGAAVKRPFASAGFTDLSRRLEQLVGLCACGMVQGHHGVGKILLVQHCLQSLPEKRFKPIVITHSSVTATDLLRLLCRALAQTPPRSAPSPLRRLSYDPKK